MRNDLLSGQRFPVLGLLLAAVSGILVTDCLEGSRFLPLAFVLVASLLVLFPMQGGLARLFVFAAFSLIHFLGWTQSPDRRLGAWLDSRPVEYHAVGVVSGEPRIQRGGGAVFPLSLQRIFAEGDPGNPWNPGCQVQVRWNGPVPAYGDRVEFRCRAGEPPPPVNPGEMNYRQWLARHGIRSVLTVDPSIPGTIFSGGHGNPLTAAAIHARRVMSGILAIGLGDAPVEAAIRGICLGITEGAPAGFTDDFRFTGTMHLFAVSGLHVGMVAVILWFGFGFLRLPRGMSAILTISSLAFYVLVTGMKMGSIRSAFMASFLILGVTLLRRSPLLNTLAAAAFLQLAFDTNALFSAGWQFSYSVVGAIILAAPRIERRVVSWQAPDPFFPPVLLTRSERFLYSVWHHLAGLAAVSSAAWIGSLIPTIAYFHLVSLSAFGANLVAVPLAFGVLSLGALSLVFGSFFPWIAGAFNNANWIVTKLLLLVVGASALIPGGHWFIGPPPKPWPELTVLDLKGGSCAVIRSGRTFALLDAGRRRDAGSIVLPCLEFLGANSLRSVVITRRDSRHEGGLGEISTVYRIGRIGLPPHGEHATETILQQSCPSQDLSPGSVLEPVPGSRLSVLAATEEGLLTRLDLGDVRVLCVPGFSPAVINALEMLSPDQRRCAVLLGPLGGAEFATTLRIIREISPRLVISGSDPYRRNGIPSGEWEGLLQPLGIGLFRTSDSGAVTVGADPRDPRAVPFLRRGSAVSLAESLQGTVPEGMPVPR